MGEAVGHQPQGEVRRRGESPEGPNKFQCYEVAEREEGAEEIPDDFEETRHENGTQLGGADPAAGLQST